MADQKITQNTERVSAVIGTDVLPLVGNLSTTPANQKVQVKNFLSNLQIDLPQTTFSALKMTAAVTANAVATLTAAEFNIVANSSSGFTVRDRYGLLVTNKIQNNTSNVTGQMAAAMFTLDGANSNMVAANTYGIIINHATDSNFATARIVPPRAFVAISDDAGTNAAALTTYFVELKSVSSDLVTANATVVFSKTADKVATHALKLRIGAQDVWVLCSNTAPA